jgi:hypothetical protein
MKRSGRDESIQIVIYFVFLFIAYVFSSTMLEIRAEQVLPGSKGVGEGQGGEMAQTMYAHLNKRIKKVKKKKRI